VFDIPAEEKAFMRAARADELYQALVDIQKMSYGAAGKQLKYLDDSDALSDIRVRLDQLRKETGDLT
jgi:hypothetical protein